MVPASCSGAAVGLLAPVAWNRFAAVGPRTLTAGAGGNHGRAAQAHPGDTVMIPEGKYRERIELREGVTLRAQHPGTVTLISPDGGPAVIARGIESGGIEGVWIQGDIDAPLAAGIEIVDASPSIANVRITGATYRYRPFADASAPAHRLEPDHE